MQPATIIARVRTLEDHDVHQLAELLCNCVEGGASVGFMLPLSHERACAFWQRIAVEVAAGHRAMLVARAGGQIVGTVQLVLDLPENQPHRADLGKMLVHARARRQGLGKALMLAAEQLALECGRSLLVLDAVTDGNAARLYAKLGWVRVGDVPQFAFFPSGGLCSTTYFYKALPQVHATRGS